MRWCGGGDPREYYFRSDVHAEMIIPGAIEIDPFKSHSIRVFHSMIPVEKSGRVVGCYSDN